MIRGAFEIFARRFVFDSRTILLRFTALFGGFALGGGLLAGPGLPFGSRAALGLDLGPGRVVLEIVVHHVVPGGRLDAPAAGVPVLVPQTGGDQLPGLRGGAVELRHHPGNNALGEVLGGVRACAEPQAEGRVPRPEQLGV
ncbi:hypothetical protein N0X72_25460 [Streptomyces carpaticus]|uniref:hypothetical protein n=1 Tax=Streptomyces carpaticus TaxID=285558 RepID=UPI0021FB9C30|nr:hypothetical protein N0X72_25460 [Streptomyces carpaticus]